MSATLYTLQTPPEGFKCTRMFAMIQITRQIKISQIGLLEALTSSGKDPYQQSLDTFADLAPQEANAILGVQLSTATQHFTNGTFLYLTYIGTPVTMEAIA
ncbi:MAG TPA: hypothetical protein PKE37_15220 [Thiomonas arsenitoxydans]|uniref:hypothetical protein n=1 Tax=Thiomonas arsenitoxydans (strain DSM 22701 / CIP 110005 / 3As) TaxID=426114 RepID=UPI002C235C82|nr:hypothetical protein [Thiomonas arsenitoxydans]HML83107.1 hypothetical protein [Thiomonas arsenitoxydans]